MSNFFVWLNLLSAAVVFVFAACRLSMRRWKLSQPELWAYAMLIGGSFVIVVGTFAVPYPHNVGEIVLDFGMAIYCLSQYRKLKIIERVKKCRN